MNFLSKTTTRRVRLGSHSSAGGNCFSGGGVDGDDRSGGGGGGDDRDAGRTVASLQETDSGGRGEINMHALVTPETAKREMAQMG